MTLLFQRGDGRSFVPLAFDTGLAGPTFVALDDGDGDVDVDLVTIDKTTNAVTCTLQQ